MSGRDPVHGVDAEGWGGWSWHEPTRGEHFRRCSYCGSIHPDDLAAEPAWRAEWADQKYGWPHKFYVDIPNRDPAASFVVGAASRAYPGMVAWDDLTPDQRVVAERDGWGDRPNGPHYSYVEFGTRPHHFGKFYSVHLADPAVSAEVKEMIQRRSGLRLEFAGTRVRWALWGTS